VRITAQLTDGGSGNHVWAERYDRDLNDIFALQDEISEAIVKALRLKLLPGERRAIEQRGTNNIGAYNLFLMAREEYFAGLAGGSRRYDALIRLCERATEIDPAYARAWALMALGQLWLHGVYGRASDGGKAAAERALALDNNLAEAHAVKARILDEDGDRDTASSEIELALRLNAESLEVNQTAGLLRYRQHRFDEATRFFEKAVALVNTDFWSAGMLISCYDAVDKHPDMLRAAETALARVEMALTLDRNNGAALSYGAIALVVLGQTERAKEWMSRALLVDTDNLLARYNFACSLAAQLKDTEAALDMLRPVFERAGTGLVDHAKIDPDFAILRDEPGFRAMVDAADKRLATKANNGRPMPA
jgi:adenylate cyclase